MYEFRSLAALNFEFPRWGAREKRLGERGIAVGNGAPIDRLDHGPLLVDRQAIISHPIRQQMIECG